MLFRIRGRLMICLLVLVFDLVVMYWCVFFCGGG